MILERFSDSAEFSSVKARSTFLSPSTKTTRNSVWAFFGLFQIMGPKNKGKGGEKAKDKGSSKGGNSSKDEKTKGGGCSSVNVRHILCEKQSKCLVCAVCTQ